MTPSANRKPLRKIKDETGYYEHQAEGVRLMARMGSFLLCDEMGLGKSLEALTVAAIDFELGIANRVLIVCPVFLKWNWLDEIKKFTKFTAIVLNGTPTERHEQIELYRNAGFDILIVNYEQVIAHQKELNDLSFDIIIYDEAHYIKNPKSKRTKAALGLYGRRNFMLTGSPILNQAHELWPLLYKVKPDQFPNYYRFVNRFCRKGGYQNKQVVGVKNQLELQSHIDNVMIRRLKKDCLDLPDKQYIQIDVDFHPMQRLLYIQAEEDLAIHRWAGDPEPLELENALTKALRLKQICGTTATIDGIEEDHSYKLDKAIELVQELAENDHKVVVFTQFRKVQACFLKRLDALKPPIKWFQLNGDVPMQQRSEIVKQWEDTSQPAAMVAMLQVAGVGLNMTAASHCIFLDKLWVPKLNEQAEDRLHRIGADKTQPIQIYHIVIKGSIERRIESILRQKRKLFDSLIEDSDWKKAIYQALREEEDDE